MYFFHHKRQIGILLKNGFTLIEVIVVMFIISLVLSFVSLRPGAEKHLNNEVKQLEDKLYYALDYATFNQQVLGLNILESGYLFRQYQQQESDATLTKQAASYTWTVLDTPRFLAPYRWANSEEIINMDLVVDEEAVSISSAFNDDETEEDFLPQIVILPNYEMSHFILTLIDANNEEIALDFNERLFNLLE